MITFDVDGREVEHIIPRSKVKCLGIGSSFISNIFGVQIRAGDIIKLKGHCQVPADMLLIMTSLHRDGNQCYVETANIDGETNLKLKEAPPEMKKLIRNDEYPSLPLFLGHCEYEPPNKNIHNFIGALHLDAADEPIALGAENLLLRSSIFSNTEWGYGIAIYVGQESKIQMNNRHAPSKMSKIEVYVNKAIKLIFMAQCTLVTVAVISFFALGYSDEDDFPYVYPDNGDYSEESVLPLFLENWIIFFILFNNFIPISLYVTIEMVNLGQGYFIAKDIEMYEESLNMPCAVRSSHLCQELGLVSNIFSDKTGTLTRNEMKFVKFIVDGKIYDCEAESRLLEEMKANPNVTDMTLYQFLLCLTTCHTVIREKSGKYRAESPDELALVEGANLFECGLVERGTTSMIADMMGKRQDYDVLAVNQFNADRKRMSILIRDTTTGEYVLMCKGADNIMLPRCQMSREQQGEVEKSLLDLACLGLRTLVIARKVLSESDALHWASQWKDASTALQDRAIHLENVAEDIEMGMELLGVTAIEDRLQDEVPQVIADFLKAGIVFWMLTGDKEETAINIGHSCNLLQSDTQTFFLTRMDTKQEYINMLRTVTSQVTEAFEKRRRIIEDGGDTAEIALVMDGPSFRFFDDRDLDQRAMLLHIGKCCRSVIACRLTPVQKQMLVNLVKVDTKPKATTLSIGDGANDVSMILEADVGVGIFGKEGRQAANNADFAIGQFKFLKRLLLVHGRWNYCRQSKVFLYSMHKNMVITLTLFYFSYLAAVSGTSMYESYIYSLYNFALGLPIVFLGIFDQDISGIFAMTYPQVYSTGLTNSQLDIKVVLKWIWNAIMYGVIFSYICFGVLKRTYEAYDLFLMGTMTYISLVLAMHTKVAFIHRTINQVHFWSMFISVTCLFSILYMLNINKIDNYDLYYVASEMYKEKLFWFFSVLSIPVFTIMIDLVGLSFYVMFWPSREMLYSEASLAETPLLIEKGSFDKLN